MRKILDCNKHTLKKYSKLNRDKTITGLYDCNNIPLVVGDIVQFNDYKYYVGVLQYEMQSQCFGICFGRWYGDNSLDPNNYGKFLTIPSDNGRKMHIEKIGHVGDKIFTAYGDVI